MRYNICRLLVGGGGWWWWGVIPGCCCLLSGNDYADVSMLPMLCVCDYVLKVVTRLENSDVTCHVMLLYSVDLTNAGISFIFLTTDLFGN